MFRVGIYRGTAGSSYPNTGHCDNWCNYRKNLRMFCSSRSMQRTGLCQRLKFQLDTARNRDSRRREIVGGQCHSLCSWSNFQNRSCMAFHTARMCLLHQFRGEWRDIPFGRHYPASSCPGDTSGTFCSSLHTQGMTGHTADKCCSMGSSLKDNYLCKCCRNTS